MNAQTQPKSGHVEYDAPGPVVASGDVTALLAAWRGGDRGALDRLFPLVYEELRHIAHGRLGRERTGHTLGTTALVNEVYLKLVDQTRVKWTDRAHFFAVAASAMRRILVDYARRHQSLKRGGSASALNLDDPAIVNAMLADNRADVLIALEEALTRLAEVDERLSRVVECRFFGGLTEDETAEALGITARTVRRDWIKAKGWLSQALREEP